MKVKESKVGASQCSLSIKIRLLTRFSLVLTTFIQNVNYSAITIYLVYLFNSCQGCVHPLAIRSGRLYDAFVCSPNMAVYNYNRLERSGWRLVDDVCKLSNDLLTSYYHVLHCVVCLLASTVAHVLDSWQTHPLMVNNCLSVCCISCWMLSELI